LLSSKQMPIRIYLLGALALGPFLLLAQPALAGCGIPPKLAFAPQTGAILPPNPTIWVFVRVQSDDQSRKLDELTVTDGRGRSLAVARTALTTSGAEGVTRIGIATPPAVATVIVRGRSGDETASASYRLARARRAAPSRGTELVAGRYVYASGCPDANGFLLSISPKAPVYKVELEDKTWIVPDQPDVSGSSRTGTIATGGVFCRDFGIPTDTPLALSITPLYPDGSEGDTRSDGCVPTGAPRTCRPMGRGVQRCSGTGIRCGMGWIWEIKGRVSHRE
jgi:hypothetical protein